MKCRKCVHTCFRPAARKDSIPWVGSATSLSCRGSPSPPASPSYPCNSFSSSYSRLPPRSTLHSRGAILSLGWVARLTNPVLIHFHFFYILMKDDHSIIAMHKVDTSHHHRPSFEGCKLEPPIKPHLDNQGGGCCQINKQKLFKSGRLGRPSQVAVSLPDPNKPERAHR